jgi:nucleoside-diphosphate-sugar epimerase
MASGGKPSVVILGGLGFVGRNLLKYIVQNGLCSRVRVVDKRTIISAFLRCVARRGSGGQGRRGGICGAGCDVASVCAPPRSARAWLLHQCPEQ